MIYLIWIECEISSGSGTFESELYEAIDERRNRYTVGFPEFAEYTIPAESGDRVGLIKNDVVAGMKEVNSGHSAQIEGPEDGSRRIN